MKLTRRTIYFICGTITLIYFAACAPRQITKPYNQIKTQQSYTESVGDAAKPQAWEIDKNLIAISTDNQSLVWKEIKGEKYLLVSSWKKDTIYYKNDAETGFYNTHKYPIWVTTAPELQNLCQTNKFGRKEGLDLRLKQLFGMPPNVEKNYFVEFWVRPQDLFRPCPDKDITDKTCGLAFPENTSEDHKAWVNQQRLNSYYNPDWDANYPWTQLGYTYDWNKKNKNHIGLSEFIIGTNANVVIKGFVATEDYCKEK